MTFRKHASAGYLANHMARLFAQHLAVEIAELGLAPAQFMTLLELWERDSLTQAELVERLDVEQATMANTLKRMERDGLVRRVPHPEDRRARLVRITDRARRLEAPAKQAAARVNDRALAGMSGPARDQFLSLMRQVTGNLQGVPDPGGKA